jgi:ribosome hibernation promoting factor
MEIKVHSIRFDADKKLLEFIDQKIKKLLLYFDDIISAEVFLRLENVEDKENKICEIRLEIPGNPVFAKKQSATFEEATDNVIEALRKQLQKHKAKLKKV